MKSIFDFGFAICDCACETASVGSYVVIEIKNLKFKI